MDNRLRIYRERRMLSEGDLAGAVDVTKQTIVAIEKAKYDPSLPLASKLARYFGVAVEDLFPSAAKEVVSTVATFVMTDIEDSTGLVLRLGDGYVDVLTRQRELLCDVFTEHGGRVVDDTGDANFAVFERPADAIRAAVAAQRAIAIEAWSNGITLRVRIGIHTGEAYAVGNRYVGLAVHETARVCEAAKGGRILVSSVAAAECESIRDAGTYELRGVGERQLYIAS